MFKNYNQFILPTGLVLIILGVMLAIFSPLADLAINVQWIVFTIILGISFALFSFSHFYTLIAGFVFLAISLIILIFAVT